MGKGAFFTPSLLPMSCLSPPRFGFSVAEAIKPRKSPLVHVVRPPVCEWIVITYYLGGRGRVRQKLDLLQGLVTPSRQRRVRLARPQPEVWDSGRSWRLFFFFTSLCTGRAAVGWLDLDLLSPTQDADLVLHTIGAPTFGIDVGRPV